MLSQRDFVSGNALEKKMVHVIDVLLAQIHKLISFRVVPHVAELS